MKMKVHNCFFKSKFMLKVLPSVFVIIMMAIQVAEATTYVTMNDGKLLVFPDDCIKSMTQENGLLTITALDESVYCYAIEDISSIDEQLTKELPTISSFKINNKYNHQVYSDAIGIIDDDSIFVDVACIGKRLTSSFSLSDDIAQVTVNGLVQESKVSRIRFDSDRVYTAGFNGDMILKQNELGNYSFVPYGREYVVSVNFLTDHSTSVPRIDINTVGGVNISSKTEYVDAEIIIDGAGVFPSMTDSVQIRGRGNDTWSTDPNSKNPYRLKFAQKVNPFGLTKGKSWVLLCNKRAGSMLTNAIGMKAANLIGTVAANQIIPVDLYINGTYKGSYNFTEKIGFANNSVDLDDETAAALLELDNHYDEISTQKFRSTPYDLPVNIKEPEFSEGGTVLTIWSIKNRFNSFVNTIYSGEDFSDLVDIDYLARYLIVNEYIANLELYHPRSTFCYNENILEDSSKFIFGPAWDFDWAFGYKGNPTQYFNRNTELNYFSEVWGQYSFWRTVHANPKVGRRIYELWKDFYANGLDELCEFCSDYYNYAKPSFQNNKNANLDATNYAQQVTLAQNWLRQRAEFILNTLKTEYEKPGDVNGDCLVNIADVTSLIDYLLSANNSIYIENADVDDSGEINIGDVTYLIDFLLSN